MRRLSALAALLAVSMTACSTNFLFVASQDETDPSTRRALAAYERELHAAVPGRPAVMFHPMREASMSTDAGRTNLADTARMRVLRSPAKVVVCFDEFAVREVAQPLNRTPASLVAVGMKGHPAEYGFTRRENVYGVWAPPGLEQAMKLLREAAPGASRLAVLADTSPASWAALAELGRREDWPMTIAEVRVVQTREEWLDALAAFRHRADAVLCAGMSELTDATGLRVQEQEIARATGRESTLPTVGLTRSAVMDGGLLLSVAPPPEEMGRLAAKITASVLKERPEMVEPRFAKVESTAVYANPPLARALGIELPASLVGRAAELYRGEGEGR